MKLKTVCESMMLLMRWLACLGLLTGLAACWAQPSGQEGPAPQTSRKEEPSLPDTSEINALFPKPQIIINVREHQFSPDLVTVTLLSSDYPQELLRSQLDRLGAFTGSPPRGLVIAKDSVQAKTSSSFLKASFATDNIIDRQAGQLHLERVIRPFLGAPEPHQLKSFLVTFEGESPTKRTLRLYSSDSVLVSGAASLFPKGIEYKVLAKTQDPERLTIPTEGRAPEAGSPPKGPELSPAFPFAALMLLIAGSLALGALVYFFSVRFAEGRRN